jgi:two-component system sensor histidine kinase VicK
MEKSLIMEKQLAEANKREADLQMSIDDLMDFIENASVPLHWVNGSGIIIWANKAELELLGYSKEEYIGKHISTFHADKNNCEDILEKLISKQTLQNYPAVLKTKDGEAVQVIINSNVRWHGDKFVHTRCFTRDITDLRKLEAEKVNQINELQRLNFELKSKNRALKKELQSLKGK